MTDRDRIHKMIGNGQFSISVRHIEQQRPWRGILVIHVRQALKTAKVLTCNANTAVLQGADADGRVLEMPVKPIIASFRACESWKQAEFVHVLTAYIPDGKTNDTIRKLIYRLRLTFLGDRT